MPVVIDELEVVADTAPPAQRETASGQSQTKEEKPDLQDMLRLLHERHERVRAY